MKFKKYVLVFLVGLLVLFVPLNAVFAESFQQDVPDTPDDIVQVILVLDVSKSMNEPILSDDLPEELLNLSEQISAIQDDPEIELIEEQINEIWNDPEVVAAREVWQETVDALNVWILEKEYGESQEVIMTDIGGALAVLGCNPTFSFPITTAMTIDEVDHWIDQSCTGVSISFDEKQSLRDMVTYLGDPEFAPLQQTSDDAYLVYYEALEARNYNEIVVAREQWLEAANLGLLTEEFNTMILDLGIPRKLDLAKLAAKTLLDLSRLDSVAGRRISIVGLVRFSSDYVLLQSLTEDLDIIDGKIDVLEPLAMTNIYGGLDEALRELESNSDPTQPIVIILLSDGHITVGPTSEQVLADIPPRAEELGATICTVGIGPTEAHVDWPLLKSLAEETDGEYLFAEKAEELVNFFIACRQVQLGDVTQFSGYISPGDPSVVDPISVGANVCELSLALNYVKGAPKLEIQDPDGTAVEIGYPDFTVQLGNNLTLYTLLSPLEGEWEITVNSGDAPDDDVFYNIVITSNECKYTPTPEITQTPSPTRTPIPEPSVVDQATPVIPLVIVVLVVMGVFIVITIRRK